MFILLRAAGLAGLLVTLAACGSDSESDDAAHSSSVTIKDTFPQEKISRLSYEDQVHQATALLVIRNDIDAEGKITPVVTHRKSRLGSDKPPFQVGDVYSDYEYEVFLEMTSVEPRQQGEGSLILFFGDPPRSSEYRIIRDGAISGVEPVPIETVLAGFDGAPIKNGDPAEVLTLEPDFEKGETSSTQTTVSEEEKDLLVDILESHGLRYQVAPQGDEFVVGWTGSGETVDAVFEEFLDKCL